MVFSLPIFYLTWPVIKTDPWIVGASLVASVYPDIEKGIYWCVVNSSLKNTNKRNQFNESNEDKRKETHKDKRHKSLTFP
jgi:hypothetical protein